MALEVLHNLALTHENEQFRRVSRIMRDMFDEHDFSGILIGNPTNSNYKGFQPDAILLYNRGCVLIDFKDCSGRLVLPKGEEAFQDTPWVLMNEKQVVEVKGGSHKNPFIQLSAYRNILRQLIEVHPLLKERIDPSRVYIANFFPERLKIANVIPGKFKYYKIVRESEIRATLYDLNSPIKYDDELAKVIKELFPATIYKDSVYEASISSIHIEKEITLNPIVRNVTPKGDALFSIEGYNENFNVRQLARQIIKHIFEHHPKMTFKELQAATTKTSRKNISSLEEIKERQAKTDKQDILKRRYFYKDILISSDGIKFVISTQWSQPGTGQKQTDVGNLIEIARLKFGMIINRVN